MSSPTPPTASSAQVSSTKEANDRQPIPTSHVVIFVTLAVVGCVLDLASKSFVFSRLGNVLVMEYARPPVWLWEGVFGFETHVNEGALFGMGQGQVRLFATLSVIAFIGVLYWLFIARAAADRLLTFSLGCITAGIFGNLYDRVGLHGLTWQQEYGNHEIGDRVFAVRDWIHFKIDAIGFDWPLFNIADSFLVVGACLLAWHAFFGPHPNSSSSSDGAATTSDQLEN